MKKFTIKKVASSGATYILHNLEPKLKIQVIRNDDFEYDKEDDIYDLFEFRGNIFAFVVISSEIDLDEVDDFSLIRSIIRRSWAWYKKQVYIEKYVPEDGAMENERFILQESETPNWWICTDKINGVVIKFKHKMFNESQKVTALEDFDLEEVGVTGVARILREMADWLVENHSGKI